MPSFDSHSSGPEYNGLTDAELMRYSRQILLAGWDLEAQLRLKNSRVVVVGAGGLGCPATEILARAGVGYIHLIDDDAVEISNLQRQTLFVPTDVGRPKAQVAAQALRRINELITVEFEVARVTPLNAEQLLGVGMGCDDGRPTLLLDCSDNFATRDLINRFSVRFNIPLLTASAIGTTGQLALFEPSQRSGCYHCIFATSLDQSVSGIDQTSRKSDEVFDEQTCANSGVLSSTTAVMGSLQANTALQYLGLISNPLAQKLLLWDGRHMTQRLIGYRRDESCQVCCATKAVT